jgi:hypothetical protein
MEIRREKQCRIYRLSQNRGKEEKERERGKAWKRERARKRGKRRNDLVLETCGPFDPQQ